MKGGLYQEQHKKTLGSDWEVCNGWRSLDPRISGSEMKMKGCFNGGWLLSGIRSSEPWGVMGELGMAGCSFLPMHRIP